MSHFKETCPNCYMNKGYSISLVQKNGVWHCNQCNSDYIVGDDGYFKRVNV